MDVKNLPFLGLMVIMLLGCAPQKPSAEWPDIIPIPCKAEQKDGYFKINGKTIILVNAANSRVQTVADGLKERLSEATGGAITIRETTGDQARNSIFLNLDPALDAKTGKEGYNLSVDKSKIKISASEPAGLFYGIQTLYQLLPPGIYGNPDSLAEARLDLRVPCCEVTDMPAFPWRGMHLDVSRHFFPKEFIKKYIDLIALHKMNIFHWHLTDDNGWRIQTDRYPLLTEVAAWRADREGIPWTECKPQDPEEPATYGGFYTKADIREIVEYARQRFVTIIPEIEMPGHSSEIFAAYPEFSCTGKKIPVQTGSYWPNTDIFCAGKEGTFTFIANILDEVCELFPSEYIHIGGDEADKTAWKACPDCQARIRKEGLRGVDELQSYFIKRIERYLDAKGKKLIGWDEILQGGVAPGATVMSWQGYEGGIDAARQGHEVVMCPVSHCYFDYYQADPEFQPKAAGGLTTLKKVYSFSPVPSDLSVEERKLVLGGQGNLWTEYISAPSYAEYMALPRMTALAEVLWSPAGTRDWDDFQSRLQTQFARFKAMNANYCKGSGKVEAHPLMNGEDRSYTVKLETEIPETSIFYTLDGNEPDKNSFRYIKPLRIDTNATIKAIAYLDGKKLEKPSTYNFEHHKAIGVKIIYHEPVSERYRGTGPQSLIDGLKGSLNYNDGYWQGFNGNNIDVVIDFGQDLNFESISTTFLQDQKKWIFLPREVNYFISDDGKNFQKIAGITHNIPLDDKSALTNDFRVRSDKALKARYLQVEAVNIGICPDWHPGKGQKAWIFADEIVVN
jgi:hexosaminidase